MSGKANLLPPPLPLPIPLTSASSFYFDQFLIIGELHNWGSTNKILLRKFKSFVRFTYTHIEIMIIFFSLFFKHQLHTLIDHHEYTRNSIKIHGGGFSVQRQQQHYSAFDHHWLYFLAGAFNTFVFHGDEKLIAD